MGHIQVVSKNKSLNLLKTRRQNRIVAFMFCFQLVMLNKQRKNFLKEIYENKDYNWENTLAWEIIEGVSENLIFLKSIIQKYLKKGWVFDRLNTQDQTILLTSCYEMLFIKTSCNIVINEAIEITKIYSSTFASKWINGVLDKIIFKERKKT